MTLAKRPLGQTGIEVSVLGLGTVKFGRNQAVKYPQGFSLPSDAEIRSLLAQAYDWGINVLDTAPAYGSSEARLGNLLKGQRERWVLISKAGEFFEGGQSRYDFSPAALTASVEASMKRLKTDYLDAVLVHSNGDDMRIIDDEGALDTLAELKQRGWICSFGMSTKTIEGGMAAIEQSDMAMVTYNPLMQEEQVVIEHAAACQKGILVKKALASGHIDMSPGEALRFVLQQSGVSSVVVGTINPEHLQANVASLGGV